ncbi:hypothetical protein J3R30DRAFT_3508479 [Lentinula aciculospora]|uniref:Nuclear fusion protein KAR5 n=1 Tax=Lentinula aciculospora TaxID=153920 RepID=A0A9W9DK67_9AGAR|nr:hypothetical protein J3R30DRAFT_3508479 [Lentinula aciculospora]
MHLLSYAATVQCIYVSLVLPAVVSGHRDSPSYLTVDRQKSLEDLPRKTLVEIGLRGDVLSDSYFASLGRSSDCFRKVAGSIRTRCAELDMNEDERVGAAISMTLCELATAKHHAPPMECELFSARLHRNSGPNSREMDPDSQGDCVNALSRSAQFWSSYSGYLREVPQLCFTFQRGNDIDNAKDIFQNISLNQELFLQTVVDREHANKVHVERWSAFFDHSAELTDQLSLLSRQIQKESSSAVDELQRSSIETINMLSRSLSELRTQLGNDHSVQVNKIDSALVGLSERHSQDLQAIVSELGSDLHRLIIQSSEVVRQHQETVLGELTTSVQDQWRVLYSEFSAMQEAISHLTASTTSTALSVASLSHQTSQEIHQAHALISNSANQLNDVLNTLAGRTNEHMDLLDVKVVELKDKLLLPAHRQDQAWFSYENVTSERWWKGNLVRLLGLIIRGASLSAWINSPFLKILEIVWIITFWLLRRSLSTLTSFIVLCLSYRRYIHRILVASTSNQDPENLGTQRVLLWPSNDSYNPTLSSSLTSPTSGPGSQSFRLQSLSSPLETTFAHRYDPRPPQTRFKINRIRLPSASANSAAPARSKTSRIPDRLCIPNLA